MVHFEGKWGAPRVHSPSEPAPQLASLTPHWLSRQVPAIAPSVSFSLPADGLAAHRPQDRFFALFECKCEKDVAAREGLIRVIDEAEGVHVHSQTTLVRRAAVLRGDGLNAI